MTQNAFPFFAANHSDSPTEGRVRTDDEQY